MSLNGLFNNQFPLTLDGTQSLDASSISIDGVSVDISNLVPYTGATQTLDMGIQNIKTSHTPVANEDVVNLITLQNAVTFVDNSIALTYLNKITSSDQTVAGKVTYTKELDVTNEKPVTLGNQVVVGPNYPISTVSSATVTVSQHFGSITNSGGVYQATTDIASGTPILIGFPITNGKKYRFTVEFLVEDPTYTWYIDAYQSVDNVNPVTFGVLGFTLIPANTSVYTTLDYTFDAVTTGNVIFPTTNDASPTISNQAVKWRNLVVYEQGVALAKVTIPSLTADRVAVFDESHRLVSSGINVTKLGYLDNVSSDIQTQLNGKLANTSGQAFGTFDFTSTVPILFSGFNGSRALITNASKQLAESAVTSTELGYVSGVTSGIQGQLNGKLSLTGGTMTGTLVMGANKVTSTYVPANGEDLTNKTYVDGAITGAGALYVLKSGDTMAGTLYNSVGNFHSYRGGDTNRGCVLFANDADGATLTTYNGGLASWWGIGFYSTNDNTTRFVFNTRDGSSTQLGTHTIDVTSPTTAYQTFITSENHYDGTASTTYLMSGINGYLTIAKKTTQNDTEACLMLGTDNSVSQLISTTTDGTDTMPLNFKGSSFLMDGGALTVIGNIAGYDFTSRIHFISSGYYLNCGNGNNDGEESTRTQIAFGWHGNSVGYRHRITSEHNGGQGASGNGNSLNFYLWSNSDAIGAMGSNHKMTIAGRGVGINTTAPEGDLHVQLAGAVNDYWGKLVVKTTSWWGDGCSSRSETAGTQYATMYQMMFLSPHVVSDTDGYCRIRYGRAGGVSSGRWWETGVRSDGLFQISPENTSNRGLVINPTFGGLGINIAPTTAFDCNGTALFRATSDPITLRTSTDFGNTICGLRFNHADYRSSYLRSVIQTNRTELWMIVNNSSGDQIVPVRVSDSGATVFGSLTGSQVYTDDWFRINSNYSGLYWQNLGYGLVSPLQQGNSYGNVTTYGAGSSSWQGYGIRGRFCFMAYSYADDWGIHDNTYSWLIRGNGGSTRRVYMSGGVGMFAREWDLFVVWRTATEDDWGNGYFYVNQGYGYGYTSDRRIKQDIETIPEDKSVVFIKNLQPSRFRMRDTQPVKCKIGDEEKEVIPDCCNCQTIDGFIAQNVLESAVKAQVSKSLVNHWYDYEEEMKKPAEEQQLTRENILGINDTPILSHTVNVVKRLLQRVEVLEAREAVWLADARAKEKEFADYKAKTEERLSKLASLVTQLMNR